MKKTWILMLSLLLVCSMMTGALAADYTATAQGFGGDVTVTLSIEDGVLTQVAVDANSETEGIGSRAVDILPTMMVEANSTDADTVAGATITSKAILEAASAALAESGAALAAKEAEAPSTMVPGVYTGSAKGFHGTLTAEVEVTEDAIAKVTVLDNGETVNVGTLAIPLLESSIVENQSLADTVSGVTFSSNAINGAVADAMKQAGANSALLNDFLTRKPAVENPGDTETDIVVVGAGTAGMVAAIQAADKGAHVILLEKEGVTGGSARLSYGCIWAIDMPETTEEYNFTVGDVYSFFDDYAGPVNNKPVFDAVVGNTTAGINYLRENGYTLEGIQKSHHKIAPQFTSMTATDNGPGFAEMLTAAVAARDIDLRYNSPAVELAFDENQQVCGVVVENEAGRYTVNAGKVILATGGFTYNEEMMAQYADGHDKNNMQWTAIGATGDGHIMGLAAGGRLVGQGTLNIHSIDGRMDSFFDMMPLWNMQLVVDQNGQQLIALDEHYSTIADKITQTEDGKGYVIADSSFDYQLPVLEELVADGDAYKADTIEELAVLLGVNPEKLAATVATHNAHFDNQTDDELSTPAAALSPITKAPYYGYVRRSVVMGTITALDVNTDMQVLREDGTAIENLYAAGELIFGNIFNNVYPMSGTAITVCISSGQLAAQAAAASMGTAAE